MASFFGIDFKKADPKSKLKTFEIEQEAGVEQRINPSFLGASSYAFDMVQIPTDEVELIQKCRELAKTSEIEKAITEIRNEMFIFDTTGKRAFSLDFLDECKLSKQIREKIIQEYINLYNVTDFHNRGNEYFTSWYVDGKLFLHKVTDSEKPKLGIKRVVKIEPFNIRKIREYPQEDMTGIFDLNSIEEYYIYSENLAPSAIQKRQSSNMQMRSLGSTNTTALRINKDSIAYTDSGIYDENTGMVLSFLHKSLLPYNNLKLLEDASIIYKVTRAPSRRIFYIDTANIPKQKSEAYVKSVMERFRTKVTYDSKTGAIVDKKNVLSMVEDYWFPRQGDKSTEVQELSGGDEQNTDLLEYYKNKLYNSMNVPMSRFTEENSFSFGKSTEISRDEFRFKKIIDNLRQRFMFIFEDLLRTQLLLKNIISPDDWIEIKRVIQWVFTEDNAFVEWKETEILMNRLNNLIAAKELVDDNFISKKYAMRTYLKFSDEDIAKMQAEIKQEAAGDIPDESEDGEIINAAEEEE